MISIHVRDFWLLIISTTFGAIVNAVMTYLWVIHTRNLSRLLKESSEIRTRYHEALMYYARGGEDEGQRALRAFEETLNQ